MDAKFENLLNETKELLRKNNIPFMSDFTNENIEYMEFLMVSHMQMVQGPWQRLGITIERLISDALAKELWSEGESKEYDYNHELPIEESLSAAKEPGRSRGERRPIPEGRKRLTSLPGCQSAR